jgi:hypothetical protein
MPEYAIGHNPDSVQITDSILGDQKVSAADVVVYARVAYACTMYPRPDLDLLVNEFRMPREETEAALLRLAALGYLDSSERPSGAAGA